MFEHHQQQFLHRAPSSLSLVNHKLTFHAHHIDLTFCHGSDSVLYEIRGDSASSQDSTPICGASDRSTGWISSTMERSDIERVSVALLSDSASYLPLHSSFNQEENADLQEAYWLQAQTWHILAVLSE